MRLALTHLLFAGGDRPPDALATSIDETPRRFFVPGWLPCGECGPCRRGWVSACPRGRTLVEPGAVATTLEVGERFLGALDEPPGAAPLDEPLCACAGVVAELMEISARAGLGGGDVAVWIGDDGRSTLGARLSAGRGCATFQLAAAVPLHPGVTLLSPAEGAGTWSSALVAAATAAPGGFQERRLFVSRPEPALVASALALAVPGATISFLDPEGPASIRPSQLPSCRILVAAGRGFHPDLVPEALAALRRDGTLVRDLLVEGSATGARDDARLTLVRL